ncbi:MAG TPA: ferritin [Candidatus Eisenbacteria bacterium]|nr:ferritin [Candidatus Eisenbacteria bacterium]
MPANAVPKVLVSELQRQLNHELAAAHAYTALAVWSYDRNLKGFAHYFYKQAGEERVHAQKFMDHLLDRGVMPELSAVPAPRTTFKALVEVARHARAMEEANTKGIHRAYEIALKQKDYPAQVLLHWYVNEQVEEEAWCDEMVARAESSTSEGGLQALDRHIERYLADRGHDGGDPS